jgi:hypothetical protein
MGQILKYLDAAKFWALRHAFWVTTTIALLGIVVIVVLHAPHVARASGALATLLGFYVASLSLLLNQVRASVVEYNRLEDIYKSERMDELRALVASNYSEEATDDWEDLFDFFEEIAFKTRLGIIEMQVAYQMFSYWVLGYWFLCEGRLDQRRKSAPEDTDLYSELEWLVRRFAVTNLAARRRSPRADKALEQLRSEFEKSRARFVAEEKDLGTE